MRYVTSSVLVLLLGFCGANLAAGQGGAAVRGWAARHDTTVARDVIHVRVRSNFPQARLFADSLSLGVLPSRMLTLPASTRRLRLVPPASNAWSITPVERELQAQGGDTVDVVLDFPYHYRIESVPYDAHVLVESGTQSRAIGSTPLLYTSAEPIDGVLVVEEPGFVRERIEPGNDVWNRHVVLLSPARNLDATAAQVQWKPPKRHRAWIDYAALGTALAAGAVAVHYKFRADALYARYENSGDPALRPDIESYDLRSGIAFGVMQAGIGLFAIRLALR